MKRDKHWMSLVYNDELYFVHSLDPLRILHCKGLPAKCDCEFVYQEKIENGFKDYAIHLRGGTPFVLYQHPYYISVAHNTLFKERTAKRYYSAHLVVVTMEPSWRVVYVSDGIQVHPQVYDSSPQERPLYIEEDFIFPVGLTVDTVNSLLIGAHANDHSAIIVRLTGVYDIMKEVIGRDKGSKGPKAGYLQEYIHDSLETNTKLKFIHQKS